VIETLFDVPEELYRRRRCRVCGCALSVRHAATYVVVRQGWVKIGATDNPRRRLSELARVAWAEHLLYPDGMDWTEPLDVVTVFDLDVEHDLHARFVDQHERGEWFRLEGPLVSWVDESRAGTLLP
jgi:hypothetical protein